MNCTKDTSTQKPAELYNLAPKAELNSAFINIFDAISINVCNSV